MFRALNSKLSLLLFLYIFIRYSYFFFISANFRTKKGNIWINGAFLKVDNIYNKTQKCRIMNKYYKMYKNDNNKGEVNPCVAYLTLMHELHFGENYFHKP